MGISENTGAAEQKKMEDFFKAMQSSWMEFSQQQQSNQEEL